MTKFIAIAGLPGSGKSFYCKELCQKLHQDGFYVLWVDDACLSKNQRDQIVRVASCYDYVIMASPIFCDIRQREACEKDLRENFSDCIIEWRFFVPDYDQCMKNVIRRNDGREVTPTMKRFRNYKIPPNAITLPVWRPENPPNTALT